MNDFPPEIGNYCYFYSLILTQGYVERGRERESETSIGSQLGLEPATSVCALTGNQTLNFIVYGMIFQTTEPLTLGWKYEIIFNYLFSLFLS